MALKSTHLIGDQKKTWDQRFRFAQAKGRGHRFPLSSVSFPFGPSQALVTQSGGELVTGDSFNPQVAGVENVGNSLGIGGPQTVFLFRASPVKTPIGEGWKFDFQEFTYPDSPFPTHDAAVCGQIAVLELAYFSILQKRRISCSTPRSHA